MKLKKSLKKYVKKYIMPNNENDVNIQYNIDTTEINDLSDNEIKILSKNPLHPRQRLRRVVNQKIINEK